MYCLQHSTKSSAPPFLMTFPAGSARRDSERAGGARRGKPHRESASCCR